MVELDFILSQVLGSVLLWILDFLLLRIVLTSGTFF